MERAFQTALWLLQPEVVFILGDIFDEGKWSSPQVGPAPGTLAVTCRGNQKTPALSTLGPCPGRFPRQLWGPSPRHVLMRCDHKYGECCCLWCPVEGQAQKNTVQCPHPPQSPGLALVTAGSSPKSTRLNGFRTSRHQGQCSQTLRKEDCSAVSESGKDDGTGGCEGGEFGEKFMTLCLLL